MRARKAHSVGWHTGGRFVQALPPPAADWIGQPQWPKGAQLALYEAPLVRGRYLHCMSTSVPLSLCSSFFPSLHYIYCGVCVCVSPCCLPSPMRATLLLPCSLRGTCSPDRGGERKSAPAAFSEQHRNSTCCPAWRNGLGVPLTVPGLPLRMRMVNAG